MAQRILSIDLQTDLLTAVILNEERNREITATAAIAVNGRSSEEIITELTSTLDCSDCRCFLSLGTAFFTFQNLTLPFSDPKSVEKVLPLELSDTILGSPADMAIDALINRQEDGTAEVITAMIDQEVLADYYQQLTNNDIFPEVITISGLPTIYEIQENGHPPEEFLFLDLRLEGAALFLVANDTLQLIRPLSFTSFPFAFDNELTSKIVLDEETAQLSIQGLEHSAESFQDLALTVKQTLASLSLPLSLQNLPIYIDGTAPHAPSVSTWLDAAFAAPCMICGRAGLLPLPSDLPEDAAGHARFLTAALSLAFQGKNSGKGLNFSKNQFSHIGDLAGFGKIVKSAALPLFIVTVLFLGYLIYDTGSLKNQRAALVSDIHDVFKKTLPDVKRIVDPVQQLQVAVKEARFSSTDGGSATLPYTVLDILRELSIRIPASLDVKLTRMVYESKDLRLMGTTDTFNTVDSMKKSLEKSQFFSRVTISSANMNPKDNNVRFELKLLPGANLP